MRENKKRPSSKVSTAKEPEKKKRRGIMSNVTGLLFEQRVANYFVDKGWSPKARIRKYGYEYDLYAVKSDILSTEYLVVECKCKGRVSAKDVVRFIRKVDTLYANLPEFIYKPPLHAYLCHTDKVDPDAEAVAKSHKPSVKLLKIEA